MDVVVRYPRLCQRILRRRIIIDLIVRNADGNVDDADDNLDSSTATNWYADTDSDGFGDASNYTLLCEMPSGYVADNTDCDDSDSAEYPGATEYCDGDENGRASYMEKENKTIHLEKDEGRFTSPSEEM